MGSACSALPRRIVAAAISRYESEESTRTFDNGTERDEDATKARRLLLAFSFLLRLLLIRDFCHCRQFMLSLHQNTTPRRENREPRLTTARYASLKEVRTSRRARSSRNTRTLPPRLRGACEIPSARSTLRLCWLISAARDAARSCSVVVSLPSGSAAMARTRTLNGGTNSREIYGVISRRRDKSKLTHWNARLAKATAAAAFAQRRLIACFIRLGYILHAAHTASL
jgi:hypothetical protein